MSECHMTLHRPLMDYIEFWERLRRRSIPLMMKIVHPSVQYIDPFRNLQGAEEFSGHLAERFENFYDIKFQCTNYAWAERQGNNIAYMHWTIKTKRRQKSLEKIVTGIAEITFYEDKTIRTHIDHWHATEDIFAMSSLRHKLFRL